MASRIPQCHMLPCGGALNGTESPDVSKKLKFFSGLLYHGLRLEAFFRRMYSLQRRHS